MKHFSFVLICVLLFQSPAIFASQPVNEITLNVQFDSVPNKPFYDQSLHVKKTVSINLNDKENNIVMTQSKIVNNSPVTLAMLVKSKVSGNQVSLQFNLVHYGFNRGGSIITQPKMILKNGQEGEMEFGPYKLKVVGKWTDVV